MSHAIPSHDDGAGGPPTPAPGRPMPRRRPFGLRDAMIVIAAIGVLARLAIYVGPVLTIVLAVGLALAAATGGMALVVRGRSARSDPMLWAVAAAVERGLPLGPGIEAIGALCGRGMRLRSLALVGMLDRGVPLEEAVARVPGTFPRHGLVFLRLGWDGDLLGDALRDLSRRRSGWRPIRDMMALRVAYLGWTLIAMQLVVAFLLMFIAPRMGMILADFGLDWPEVSRRAIAAGIAAVQHPLAWIVLALEVLALPLLALLFLDPLEWGFGPLDVLMKRRHGAMVLRALAGEVARERPLPEALERIAGAYPSGPIRRRLRRARARVDRGQPWARALSGVGLIRPSDAAVLDAAERVGNLPWALRDLAEGLDRRYGHRLMAAGQVLYPIAVVAVSAPVFFIVVAYFVPLITIIRALAE